MTQNDIKSKKYAGVYYRVLQDGSKTFYIKFRDPITGQQQRLKIGNSKEGMNETFCNNKRIELIGKLRLGEDTKTPIMEKKRHRTTLNDLAQLYFSDMHVKKPGRVTTDRQSKYDKHFKEGLGLSDPKHITKRDAEKLMQELGKQYAAQTINSTIELASTVINYAIKQGNYTGINPFHGIDKMPVHNDRLRYLTPDEVRILLDAVSFDKSLYLFTTLLVTTGARLAAVGNLQVKNINLQTGTITLRDEKSGGNYTGFIKDNLKPILTAHISGLKPSDYVFGNDGVKLKDIKKLQRPLQRILNRLFNTGLDAKDREHRVVIHTLRHTFGSLLAIKGTPIYTIQKLMHHKDIKQTMRYAKLAPDSGRNEIDNLF